MLRVSHLADYATVLMNALHHGAPKLLTTRELAKKTQMSITTVRKIMKLLLKAHLVVSKQGVCGGYGLAQDARQIHLGQIIQAIDGALAITECTKQRDIQCKRMACCLVKGHWLRVNQLLEEVLKTVSLADMSTPLELPVHFYSSVGHDRSKC